MTCSVPNTKQYPTIKVIPYKDTYSRGEGINLSCSEGYSGLQGQPTKQCINFGDFQRNLPHCTGDQIFTFYIIYQSNQYQNIQHLACQHFFHDTRVSIAISFHKHSISVFCVHRKSNRYLMQFSNRIF